MISTGCSRRYSAYSGYGSPTSPIAVSLNMSLRSLRSSVMCGLLAHSAFGASQCPAYGSPLRPGGMQLPDPLASLAGLLPPWTPSSEQHGHCGRRTKREPHFVGLRCVGIHPQIFEAIQDRVQRNGTLDACEMRAEAEVLAVRARQVGL